MDNKITKTVSITVDVNVARKMLNVAGYNYKTLQEKSDDEIFFQALNMCSEYGVKVNNAQY